MLAAGAKITISLDLGSNSSEVIAGKLNGKVALPSWGCCLYTKSILLTAIRKIGHDGPSLFDT